MQEECRSWDVNDIVFGPAMWPTYHSLMRADFTLFDQYKFEHAGESCIRVSCCLVDLCMSCQEVRSMSSITGKLQAAVASLSSLGASWQKLCCPSFPLISIPLNVCAGEPPLGCPITAFYGSRDRRITKGMVEGWQLFTTGSFEAIQIEGHHLWPLDKKAKVSWLSHICKRLHDLEAY